MCFMMHYVLLIFPLGIYCTKAISGVINSVHSGYRKMSVTESYEVSWSVPAESRENPWN